MIVTASVVRGDATSEGKTFALSETLDAQLARLKALPPAARARIMTRNQMLMTIASAGNVDALSHAVEGTAPWEILHWFAVNMFKTATLNGQHDVVSRCYFTLDNSNLAVQ